MTTSSKQPEPEFAVGTASDGQPSIYEVTPESTERTEYRLPCQVCGRPLVPLKDGTTRPHTPVRRGTGGGEYARCQGSGYRLARWPVGQWLWHHTTGVWEIAEDRAATTRWADYLIRCVKPNVDCNGELFQPVGREVVTHGEYMHRNGWHPWVDLDEGEGK